MFAVGRPGGIIGANESDFTHWPLNGVQLTVFLLAPFIAIPLTGGLLSGIAGYTVGLARHSEQNGLKIAARGLLLYFVLMLVINGTNNLVRTSAIAVTLLACVRYVSRRTE